MASANWFAARVPFPLFTKDIKDVKGISTINALAETIAMAKT